ncbi:MAG: hypothetical protein LUH09_03280, partial [Clostridiales bacterium]|nr:hypothetical protein [Clostridiales bacterium]
DILCLENGLSVIENPKPSRGSYGSWLGENKPLTNRQKLEQMIDTALTPNCKSYEVFLAAMRTAGVEVKTGKHLAFKIPQAKRFIRCDSLSEDYTQDAIWERLEGKRRVKQRHSQQGFSVADEKRPRSLIDIQAKLIQANSPGFERWAKTYNLKKIAQTVLWMKERGISDVEKLAVECDAAVKRYHELADKTKANEARMKEITELLTAKSNVERFLEIKIEQPDKRGQQQEKSR